MIQGSLFLNPGEYFCGGPEVRIRTILGSCVAITLWHPDALLGGICHYLLPQSTTASDGNNPRYADGAMVMMADWISRSGTNIKDYRAKIFGGGNMFCHQMNAKNNIGLKNIEAGRSLLNKYGIRLYAEDVGGNGYRNIIFDIRNGDVWVRRQLIADQSCHHTGDKHLCRSA